MLEKSVIKIYTDGSCHTQQLIGAWAAIILIGDDKVVLKGTEHETTHNRMELLGIIKAVDYLKEKELTNNIIEVYSDSQYAVKLLSRKERLKVNNYITKKGTPIQNVDLVQTLINQIETYDLSFVKVKAHQKDGDVINREVDLIVRKLVRNQVIESDGR